jgi:formylglycine-generating enzyme required for sulfatase activity
MGSACTGTTTSAKSCAGIDGGVLGVTECGVASESCCTSIEVPGGTYARSYVYDDAGALSEAGDPATVSGFRLDKYEVTTARFARFIAAWQGDAGYTPPAGAGKHAHLNDGQGVSNGGSPAQYEPGWSASDKANVAPTATNLASCKPFSTSGAAGAAQLPVNCVDWYEAYAFCIWDDGFLPTEAEWEYAAAAGMQEREYPWGSTDPGTANLFAICGDGSHTCYYPQSTLCGGYQDLAGVGTPQEGAGLWGQLDLAGNVSEWSLDWYASPYSDPCQDCANLMPAANRTLRGGSFSASAPTLRSYDRNSGAPTARSGGVGFRCARSP